MSILYKSYFSRLGLLGSSDAKVNSGPRASRRSCRAVLANIRGLHRNLSDVSLLARGGYVFFM